MIRFDIVMVDAVDTSTVIYFVHTDPGSDMITKIGRIVLAAIGGTFTLSFFVYGAFENTYVNYPRVPNVELSRTVPWKAKEMTVYVTPQQKRSIDICWWIMVISGSLVVPIVIIYKIPDLIPNIKRR